MRLLFESGSTDELDNTKALLESNGIPVFISSEETFLMRPGFTGYKKGLWVCLDEQYRDALALLKNPDHQVAQSVDVEAFHRELEASKRQPLQALGVNLNKFLNVVLVLIIGGLFAALLVAVLLT